MNLRKARPGDAAALGHIQVTSWRSAFRNIASDEYLDHHVSEENQSNDWKKIIPHGNFMRRWAENSPANIRSS